jgi:two-component system response regulator AtoC
MDGLEVLKKIKEVDTEVEVIIVTAYATESSHANAITLGALEYLRKPFLMEEIYELVERGLRRKRSKTSRSGGEMGPIGSIH